MAKASLKNYSKHTPIFYRKLGDSILLFGTTLTATFAGMEVHKGWIIGAAIITAVGKMITNLFNEEEDIKNKELNEQTAN